MTIRQSFPIALLFAGLSLSLFSCDKDQVDKVPVEVREKFAKDYPEAKDLKWSLKEDSYEVDFKLKDVVMEAEYDLDGDLMEIETMIDPEQLPQPIKDYINEHHPMLFIGEASIESRADKSIYEVEMKTGTFKSKDLQFDMDGNLISDDSFKR